MPTSSDSLRIWTFSIEGQPYSKSNKRRNYTRKRKDGSAFSVSLPSKAAALYQESFTKQIASRKPPTLVPKEQKNLRLSVWVTYKNWQPDVDITLVKDLLQGVVYENDRSVIEEHAYRMPNDSDRPRVFIAVEEVGDDGTEQEGIHADLTNCQCLVEGSVGERSQVVGTEDRTGEVRTRSGNRVSAPRRNKGRRKKRNS